MLLRGNLFDAFEMNRGIVIVIGISGYWFINELANGLKRS